MRTFSGAVAAMLAGGRIDVRSLVRFDLASGMVGIWSDTYALVHEGVTYNRAAMVVSPVTARSDLTAEQMQITVSSLSPAVAAIMSGIEWHQRPALVQRAFLNAAGEVVEVEPYFSGFLDAAPIEDEEGGTLRMTLSIESNNRELSRSSGRTRSDPDQRLVSATDGFFKHATATAIDSNIFWGRKGPQSPSQS